MLPEDSASQLADDDEEDVATIGRITMAKCSKDRLVIILARMPIGKILQGENKERSSKNCTVYFTNGKLDKADITRLKSHLKLVPSACDGCVCVCVRVCV